MRRREFIALIGSAAASAPLAARAQQSTSTIRRVGILLPESAATAEARGLLEALGLNEMGWVEGQNIAFEYRSADGKEDALPKITAELVQLRLDAILAEGTAAIQATKDATQSILIVMALSNDPVVAVHGP
jgi:putative tryptophan/tyrosine transport system substrate-binding protein